jgi:hypothetical protein
MNLKVIIQKFIDNISEGDIEIYNEASIQYELAIFLRKELLNFKINLERSISYFKIFNNLVKKEIDVSIFDNKFSNKTAIEIKYPTNGQYPEQMFQFCKDIKFLEQLKAYGFQNNIFLVIVNDKNFWQSQPDEGVIYQYFRGEKILNGVITKPTGTKDITYKIEGYYKVEWQQLSKLMKYWILEV